MVGKAPDAVSEQSEITEATPELSGPGYRFVAPSLNDPRFRLTAVTMTLHVLGQVAFNFNLSIAQILVSLVSAGLVEFVVRARRERVIAWPASALLSGNGVALILRVPGTEPGDWWSMRGWYIFAGVSAAAVASKYVIRWRGTHIFNPSNLALVVAFVALGEQRVDPQILWWGPWSVPIAIAFAVILLGSVVITLNVGQMRTAISFWATFAALSGVIAASGHAITTNWHVGPLSGWPYWVTLVTSPEVLVFLFFMITDPKTSPATSAAKTIFGTSIAVVSAVIVSTQLGEFGTKVGILAGLVVLCPFVPLIDRIGVPATETADAARRAPNRLVPVGARVLGAGVLAVVACMPLVYLAGNARSFEDARGPADEVDLGRRDEFNMSGVELPEVELDPQAARSAFRLTPELAHDIGTDVAVSLLLETEAVATLDTGLLSVATVGDRRDELADAFKQIKQSTNPPPGRVSYDFKSLKVTLLKRDDGPQTPPELAVHVEAEVRTAAQKTFRLDDTFTVVEVDDTYLISGQYSPDRRNAVSAALGDLDGVASSGSDPDSNGHSAAATDATPAELAGIKLADRSVEVGLTLPQSRYDLGEGQNYRIGGAAVGDFDNDGWPDIFLSRVGYPNVLLRNVEGRLTDVTISSGLADAPATAPIVGGSTAATFIDINGDSNMDLIVLGVPGTPNRLYLGDGQGHFSDETSRWGLPGSPAPRSGSMHLGLAVADIDLDGDLDVLLVASEPDRVRTALTDAEVTNNDLCSAKARDVVSGLAKAPSKTVLLRNTGERFEDATATLGVDLSKTAASTARFADVTGDGRDDLIIGGHFCTSKLLVNVDGRFEDATAGSGLDQVSRMTGVSVADLDRDGHMDLVTTGISYHDESGECPFTSLRQGCAGNHVLLGTGEGKFRDASQDYGMVDGNWAWGSAVADLNNDSFDDLFIVNGIANVASWLASQNGLSNPPPVSSLRGTGNKLWIGAGGPPLRRVDMSGWEGFEGELSSNSRDGRAVVAADFNRDGRVDLLVVNSGEAPALLMNETVNANRWIDVQLNDPTSRNNFGVGAVVRIELTDGTVLTRRVGPMRSYQAGGPLHTHFGLGPEGSIARVVLRWPDGHTQQIDSPQPNQRLVVNREGAR